MLDLLSTELNRIHPIVVAFPLGSLFDNHGDDASVEETITWERKQTLVH
jgi:hypothetical protein